MSAVIERKKPKADLAPEVIRTVRARDLLKETSESIEANYPNYMYVEYDDGFVKLSGKRKLRYSQFIWEFHRRYPALPLIFEHHVDHVLKGQILSSNTHIELLERISKMLIRQFGFNTKEQIEEIQGLIYEITNTLHNELPKMSGRHVATADILDIIRISRDPEIQQLKKDTKSNAASIADFYSKSQKLIMDAPRFKHNNVTRMIRAKTLNINQVNQCVLARGFPIEVTGMIIPIPIMQCYAEGMYSLFAYVAESRAASKHLYSAEAPLQDTEYFARRLQLVGMVVTGITEGNCGSDKYLNWIIKPPTFTSSGRMIYQGDLHFMKGKMYLDETTNSLKEITGKEEHLFGRAIKIRSVIYCKEPDAHKVCETCFGALHHNVHRRANLGHLCDASLTQQLTQTILSTKHLIGSAVGTEIQLKSDAQKYLNFHYNTMSFYLKPFTTGSKYQLIVNRNSAIGLTDLKLLNETETIQVNPRRISSIISIEIQETLPNGATVTTPVTIEQSNRQGYFSSEFLKFVCEKKWTTNEYDHFVFDLTGWNAKHPIIRVPDMEYSYSDHADEIADMIESNTKKMNSRSPTETPGTLLQNLFDLVNSKIYVNIALLEVMVYASMTPGPDDYGLARHAPNPGMNVSRFVTMNRSLGPAYAYQSQFETISSPRSFFQENRPSSPIDVFLCPKETVAEVKSKQR